MRTEHKVILPASTSKSSITEKDDESSPTPPSSSSSSPSAKDENTTFLINLKKSWAGDNLLKKVYFKDVTKYIHENFKSQDPDELKCAFISLLKFYDPPKFRSSDASQYYHQRSFSRDYPWFGGGSTAVEKHTSHSFFDIIKSQGFKNRFKKVMNMTRVFLFMEQLAPYYKTTSLSCNKVCKDELWSRVQQDVYAWSTSINFIPTKEEIKSIIKLKAHENYSILCGRVALLELYPVMEIFASKISSSTAATTTTKKSKKPSFPSKQKRRQQQQRRNYRQNHFTHQSKNFLRQTQRVWSPSSPSQ